MERRPLHSACRYTTTLARPVCSATLHASTPEGPRAVHPGPSGELPFPSCRLRFLPHGFRTHCRASSIYSSSPSGKQEQGNISHSTETTRSAHPCSGLSLQSPGHQQQQQQHESLLRTASGQTPKHFGLTEDGSISLANQATGHDLFEQVPMTAGQPQTDKMAANEMSVLGVASGDGPLSMLPQLGDSEEKLRQVGLCSRLFFTSSCFSRVLLCSICCFLCSDSGSGSSS